VYLGPAASPYVFTAPLFDSVMKMRAGESGGLGGGGGGGGGGGAAAAALKTLNATGSRDEFVCIRHEDDDSYQSSNSGRHLDRAEGPRSITPAQLSSPPMGFSVRVVILFAFVFCDVSERCARGRFSAYGLCVLAKSIKSQSCSGGIHKQQLLLLLLLLLLLPPVIIIMTIPVFLV
jgi:hypothetical protein